MIHIEKPWIETDSENAILRNYISIDDKREIVWFKVDKEYSDYLCNERGDAYLIAVLHYAMLNSHDIKLDVSVTEQLLFNINTFLIPALIENNPQFHFPKIECKIESEPLPNAGVVATGISCGVDSLHALAEHTNSTYPSLNITHLTFNNVGSHGEGERARNLYADRIGIPTEFAKDYGFKFVASDSNLMDVVMQSHFLTHTYSSMFPVFCLQKLFKTYFYASAGYKFNEFNLTFKPGLGCGSYELLSLSVFSNGNVQVYSDGMGVSRLNKLRKVVDYKPSYKYLNVCLTEGRNCGKCEKCIRTLLGLDILGKLDNYKEVFDIDYYKKNRDWYLQEMLYQIAYGKHDYFEMYPYLKKDLSLKMKWRYLKFKSNQPGLKTTNLISRLKQLL